MATGRRHRLPAGAVAALTVLLLLLAAASAPTAAAQQQEGDGGADAAAAAPADDALLLRAAIDAVDDAAAAQPPGATDALLRAAAAGAARPVAGPSGGRRRLQQPQSRPGQFMGGPSLAHQHAGVVTDHAGPPPKAAAAAVAAPKSAAAAVRPGDDGAAAGGLDPNLLKSLSNDHLFALRYGGAAAAQPRAAAAAVAPIGGSGGAPQAATAAAVVAAAEADGAFEPLDAECFAPSPVQRARSDAERNSTSNSCTGTATLTVWSEGAPIEPTIEKHLFEPFFSSESRSSGLGLYICRELCTRHGAMIRYERQSARRPQLADGNAFIVQFRRAASSAATPTQENLLPT